MDTNLGWALLRRAEKQLVSFYKSERAPFLLLTELESDFGYGGSKKFGSIFLNFINFSAVFFVLNITEVTDEFLYPCLSVCWITGLKFQLKEVFFLRCKCKGKSKSNDKIFCSGTNNIENYIFGMCSIHSNELPVKVVWLCCIVFVISYSCYNGNHWSICNNLSVFV